MVVSGLTSARHSFFTDIMHRWVRTQSYERCSTALLDCFICVFYPCFRFRWPRPTSQEARKEGVKNTTLAYWPLQGIHRSIRVLQSYGLFIFDSSSCYTECILQAPGEAEAELAYLNRHGFIDAIVTNDSDALVFGAKCVLKRCVNYSKFLSLSCIYFILLA